MHIYVYTWTHMYILHTQYTRVCVYSNKHIYNRRKFRSQTSDNMDRWKSQRWEESEKRREEKKKEDQRREHQKEYPGARKGRKVAKHCVFPMICGSGGSKSRLVKAAPRWDISSGNQMLQLKILDQWGFNMFSWDNNPKIVDFPLLCLILRVYIQFHHYDNWEHKHHTTYIYIFFTTIRWLGNSNLFNGVLNGFVAWPAHSHQGDL